MNINGVDIDYRFDGAHDARPTERALQGLDGLNLSCLDWMRLSHVCRLMAARNRKPKQAFVRVSGWTADGPNMRLIVDVLELLPEHVDYDRLDETGMRVVDWLNGMSLSYDWANAKETE